MRIWFSLLSKQQRIWMAASLIIGILIVVSGILFEQKKEVRNVHVTVDMSIKEAAKKLGVTKKSLARELELPLRVPKKKLLKKLGVSQERLNQAAHHIVSHVSGFLKYYIYLVVVLWGLVFLTRLGKPDNAQSKKDRRVWYPQAVYFIVLFIALAAAGFALGKYPNPMEGIVKVFKSMVGLYPDPLNKVIAFAFFIVLAIIGNKLICGWACPFGALQELVYSIPFSKKIKHYKPPFWLSNTIRIIIFAITILLLFGVTGSRKGLVLYHYINPFNLFDFDFNEHSILMTIIIVLIMSLFIYRPFCQFVCPFGLVSWIAERFSIARVQVDHNNCTKCGACIRACPVDAAKGLVEKSKMPADCFSCARCLNICPDDAIHYKFVLQTKRGKKGEI